MMKTRGGEDEDKQDEEWEEQKGGGEKKKTIIVQFIGIIMGFPLTRSFLSKPIKSVVGGIYYTVATVSSMS